MALDAAGAVGRVGQPQMEHLDHAGRIVGDLPQPLLDAAREPFAAQAVIFSLLLSREDGAVRERQLQLLQGAIAAPLFREVQQLAGLAQSLAAESRLPLVDLTVPALKQASPQQYGQFRRAVEALVAAEGHVDLFEYSLRMVLFSYLDVHFGLMKPPAVRYRTIAAVCQPASVVLSTLAYVGQSGAEEVARAFQAEAEQLGRQVTLLPREQCKLAAFDAAVAQLAQADASLKRGLIAAATACVAADGKVTVEESELLRALAAALACPMPPLTAARG
jgi:hypothetical protein